MKFIIPIIFGIIFILSITQSYARSGCCSHHSGVRSDGCGCNDGTPLSSTCAPYYTCTYSVPQNTLKPTTTFVFPTYIPTTTTIPTNTPSPTATPSITASPYPTSNSNNATKEVAGISTQSNDNMGLTILSLLLFSGFIGGLYFKNKKDKNNSTPSN